MEKECVYSDSRGIRRNMADFAWQQKRGNLEKFLKGFGGTFYKKFPQVEPFSKSSGQALRRVSQSQATSLAARQAWLAWQTAVWL